jgi:hypothetical protein
LGVADFLARISALTTRNQRFLLRSVGAFPPNFDARSIGLEATLRVVRGKSRVESHGGHFRPYQLDFRSNIEQEIFVRCVLLFQKIPKHLQPILGSTAKRKALSINEKLAIRIPDGH